MSKHQAVRAIKSEINKLNREIDRKIIKGIPYAQEARRHSFLTSQLKRLVPVRESWFPGSLSFLSFMF